MTLPSGSLHASTLLASSLLFVFFKTEARRGWRREQSPTTLFRRAGLLHQLGTAGQEVGGGWGHANGIKVGEVVPRGGWYAGPSTSRRLLGGSRWHTVARRSRRCDLAVSLHSSLVRPAAATASGGSRGLSDANDTAIDIAQGTRLHALAALGSTTRNDRAVDCVWGLVEPLVFSLATKKQISHSSIK